MAALSYDYNSLIEYHNELISIYNGISECLDNMITNYNSIISCWDSKTQIHFQHLIEELIKQFYIVISKMNNAYNYFELLLSNYQGKNSDLMNISWG